MYATNARRSSGVCNEDHWETELGISRVCDCLRGGPTALRVRQVSTRASCGTAEDELTNGNSKELLGDMLVVGTRMSRGFVNGAPIGDAGLTSTGVRHVVARGLNRLG